MNELALFAGAGGGLLGSKLLGWRAVCYVENDPYCVQVIQQRIRDGMLDDAPIWDDVRTFDGRPWSGCVDIVTGGFPCQPWSVAGKRAGELDERNLWPDTIRIVREVRPKWCLLENVPGLLSKPYVRRIFADLAESGYSVRWDCIPAAFVGAPHLRYRLWILAHADSERTGERYYSNSIEGQLTTIRERRDCQDTQNESANIDNCGQNVPDANGGRCEQRDTEKRGIPIADALSDVPDADKRQRNQQTKTIPAKRNAIDDVSWWATEPELGRVADGMANRVERLRAIGNGQVPAVVRAAWELMR